MIRTLAVVLQPKMSPNFGIQNTVITQFFTLLCFHYSQPGPVDDVLDLFNALNLVAPSILPSAQWLWWCKHKHIQFSHFQNPAGTNIATTTTTTTTTVPGPQPEALTRTANQDKCRPTRMGGSTRTANQPHCQPKSCVPRAFGLPARNPGGVPHLNSHRTGHCPSRFCVAVFTGQIFHLRGFSPVNFSRGGLGPTPVPHT